MSPCQTGLPALEALSKEEIDLCAPAFYSSDRARQFLFCSYPSGNSYTAILAPSDSSPFMTTWRAPGKAAYRGPHPTLSGAKDFADFVKQRGGVMPTIVEYPGRNEVREAMRKGEVDAILETVLSLKSDEKILSNASLRHFIM